MIAPKLILASLVGANAFGSGSCSKSYIVVGAGAGGAPMAYGLAMAGCEVTVVERGPDDNWTGSTVFGTPYDLWNWEISWMYQSSFPCAACPSNPTHPHPHPHPQPLLLIVGTGGERMEGGEGRGWGRGARGALPLCSHPRPPPLSRPSPAPLPPPAHPHPLPPSFPPPPCPHSDTQSTPL